MQPRATVTQGPASSRGLVLFAFDVLRGRFQYVSSGSETLLGWSSHQLMRERGSWRKLIHPADLPRLDGLLSRLRTGRSFTLTLRLLRSTQETQWVDVLLQPVLTGGGRISQIEGFITPLGPCHRGDAHCGRLIRLSSLFEQQWATAFDAIGAPVLLISIDGAVRYQNRAAAETFGRQIPIGAGGNPASADPPLPAIHALAEAARVSRRPRRQTVRSGEPERVHEISAWPVSHWSKEDDVVIMVADVTERLQLGEKLAAMEAMTALGELVGGVAHELRTPLFGMSAVLDAFDHLFGTENDYAPYIRSLRESLGQISRLTEQLLSYGRAPHRVLQQSSLGAVVRSSLQVCRTIAADHGVRVETGLHPGDVPCRVDPDQMQQVVQNVVENAVQHSPSGGVVRVSGGRTDGHVWLHVDDEGPGIAEADLPRLFEPFFSRRSGGTGLGLAVVQRIVESHGGTVEILRRDGRGTRVSIRLPVSGDQNGGG
jgi:signal transduction histidine kinase